MLLHPPLASFPVVILTLILGFEIFGRLSSREGVLAASRLLTLIVLPITLITYLSGYFTAGDANQRFTVDLEIISRHESFGKLLLIVLLVVVVLRLCLDSVKHHKLLEWFFLLSLSGATLLAAYTSFLGGDLIFRHGAGVYGEELVPSAESR